MIPLLNGQIYRIALGFAIGFEKKWMDWMKKICLKVRWWSGRRRLQWGPTIGDSCDLFLDLLLHHNALLSEMKCNTTILIAVHRPTPLDTEAVINYFWSFWLAPALSVAGIPPFWITSNHQPDIAKVMSQMGLDLTRATKVWPSSQLQVWSWPQEIVRISVANCERKCDCK